MPEFVSDRPWMTALEMQFAAMRSVTVVRDSLAPQDDLESVRPHLENAAQLLRSAEAFSWTRDTTTAVAQAAQSIPEDTQLADWSTFPNPACWWWWFDYPPFTVEGEPAPQDRHSVQGLLLVHGYVPNASVGSLLIIPFGWYSSLGQRPIMFPFVWRWEMNESIEQLVARSPRHDNIVRPISRFVAAGMVWLQQRILIETKGPVERHRRKQLAREHAVPLPGDVKVIQLRRSERQGDSQSESAASVEWSCRWIVSGHWRNQPMKDGRKLIYILPYVKGPTDQPLKVPTHTVYQVSR